MTETPLLCLKFYNILIFLHRSYINRNDDDSIRIFDVIILKYTFSDYPSFHVNFLKSRGNNEVTEGADATYDECRLFRNRISPAFSPFFQANVPLACSELRIINQVQLGMITDLTASPLLRASRRKLFFRENSQVRLTFTYIHL